MKTLEQHRLILRSMRTIYEAKLRTHARMKTELAFAGDEIDHLKEQIHLAEVAGVTEF